MAQTIGIDLGTTNCCVATVGADGVPGIIPDKLNDSRVIPSYVAVKQNGEMYVGAKAFRDSLDNPHMVIYGAKRLIGRAFEEPAVRAMADNVPYEIIAGPEQEAWVRVGTLNKSPEDIAAALLFHIRQQACEHLGQDVRDAVITVPAHFNDRQRVATKIGAGRAGLNVLQLINEPTAAAIAYGWATKQKARIAVYDLGGGTFDISILNIGEGVYDVMATGGDTFLGGNDFDTRLAGWIVREHVIPNTQKQLGPKSLLRLKAAAEVAKIELSVHKETELLLLEFLDMKELRVQITREQLENLTRDLVTSTTQVCKQVLADAKIKPFEVSAVLMVGGQTRMPLIFETVKAFFARVPNTAINPDEAVAVGAALHAASTVSEKPSTVLFDVTPLTLGIASAADRFDKIIDRNSKIPCRETKTFTTVTDNQASVRIMALQGEADRASQNTPLGEFVLQGIEAAPRMTPKIDVTFELDESGILNVSAMDQATGAQKKIAIHSIKHDPDADALGQVTETDIALKKE